MRKYRWVVPLCVLAVLLAGLLLFAATPATAQLCSTGVCVTTWQQDTPSLCAGCAYRTGANLSEGQLTSNTIQNDNFGLLCSAQLDGQVYAQPLVVSNVTIGGTRYNYVAYVVTQKERCTQSTGISLMATGARF